MLFNIEIRLVIIVVDVYGESEKMRKMDWLLLVISSAKNGVLTPVQLQKSLFLIKELDSDLTGDDFYVFKPYNYGPFTAEIYRDAEALEMDGLIVISGSPSRFREYSITKEGLCKAGEIKKELAEQAVKFVSEVVAWTQSLTFENLIRAIYTHFPQYKENSVFSQ